MKLKIWRSDTLEIEFKKCELEIVVAALESHLQSLDDFIEEYSDREGYDMKDTIMQRRKTKMFYRKLQIMLS